MDAVLGSAGFFLGALVAVAIPWTGCYVRDGWTQTNFRISGRPRSARQLWPVVHQTLRRRCRAHQSTLEQSSKLR
jgi:hypothetical protein